MTPDDSVLLVQPERLVPHLVEFPRPNLEAFESPLRITAIDRYLRQQEVFGRIQTAQAVMASVSDIERVHSGYLVDTVALMSELGSGEIGEAAIASPHLLEAALYAVGSAILACDRVVSKAARHAFAIARPPGHHASHCCPMGLCFFNNIAVAVKRALQRGQVKRVSVLDFDDHFCDGTAEIFYTNADVQVISVHEYDHVNNGPGHFGQLGRGSARGTKVNVPLFMGASDKTYSSVISRVIVQAIERFQPDLIAVSAGFDAHFADPVGNMDVDSSTFWRFGSIVDRLVESVGAAGSFWVLEGGYNPLALGPCVEASLLGLMGRPMPRLPDQVARDEDTELEKMNEDIIDQVIETVSPLW
ncbi:MAG: histone deacetylase [Candidatus Thorarchaeota archaeon]